MSADAARCLDGGDGRLRGCRGAPARGTTPRSCSRTSSAQPRRLPVPRPVPEPPWRVRRLVDRTGGTRAAAAPDRARRGFRYLDLEVGPGVFVPRPETEVLAGWAIDRARERWPRTPASARPASVVRPVHRVGRDRAVRRDRGARAPGCTRSSCRRGRPRLGRAQPGRLRCRPAAGRHGRRLRRPGRHRRRRGLQPAVHPLEAYESVAAEARDHDPATGAVVRRTTGSTPCGSSSGVAARLLRPGGVVGAEHADVQGESAPAVFAAAGRWTDVRDHLDLAGRPRFVTARLAPMTADEADRCDTYRRRSARGRPRRGGHRRRLVASSAVSWSCSPPTPSTALGADAFSPRPCSGCSTPRAGAARCRRRCSSRRAPTLEALAIGVPDWARALVEELWPGPLTLVLPAAAEPAVGPRRDPRHGRRADARRTRWPSSCSPAPARWR